VLSLAVVVALGTENSTKAVIYFAVWIIAGVCVSFLIDYFGLATSWPHGRTANHSLLAADDKQKLSRSLEPLSYAEGPDQRGASINLAVASAGILHRFGTPMPCASAQARTSTGVASPSTRALRDLPPRPGASRTRPA
jgi:hypothetical protein